MVWMSPKEQKTAAKDTTGAKRAREYRKRKRRGQKIVSICFDECEMDRLRELGYFDGATTPAQAAEAYLSDKLAEE